MSSGLMQMKIYQYCIDQPDGEDFIEEKPVRPPDNAPEATRKAWENAMVEWNAGNTSVVAVIRANLDNASTNKVPTTIRTASEMIAKLRAVYGDAHTLSGHTAWDAFSRCSFSTSGTYSIQEYITDCSRLYSELIAADKDFMVLEATRFMMFVNSLDPEWQAHALDTVKVLRKNLTKCFEHLQEVARQKEMHGAMEARMGNGAYSRESSISIRSRAMSIYPSAFHTLPNSHSTSSNSPFPTYDAVIPNGAFCFLSHNISGMENVPVSTFLDSAASVHMSGSPELFTDIQPLTAPIFVGGASGSGGFATHMDGSNRYLKTCPAG
ncbi:hypothetical protein BT69DRAFT_1341687 [Atractiella rhizophila]|nr:hypothetical protein BT69DRAFT_1341687 [Atractiella rhizophila]